MMNFITQFSSDQMSDGLDFSIGQRTSFGFKRDKGNSVFNLNQKRDISESFD